MKRTIIIINIILAFSVYAYCQNRFNKLYSSDINEICQNVIVKNDGYIMCIGSDTLGARCFRLLKVDLQGNIVWNKKYGKINEAWYEGWENALFNTIDGGFALTGTRIPQESYFTCHPFFIKFNSEGDSL